MNKEKKTMYQLLEVSPNASDSEIQAAHQHMSQNLQSKRNDTNREDIDFKLRVIMVAFNTLSIKRTRDAYDARLSRSNAPNNAAASLSMAPIVPREASLLKNEAMSLKAEAMSLKAEAVSLRADVIALKVDTGYQSSADSVLEKSSRMLSPIMKSLKIVGSLFVIGIVIQIVFNLLINREAKPVVGEASKAQEERIRLQTYYQETGVRASSIAEMELLQEESRRKDREQREMQAQERAKQEQERQGQKFVDDSRREGEKVSENLRIAEERARYEEEQKNRHAEEVQRMKEDDQRRKEEQESERIEREKDRWKSTLSN